MTPVQMKQVHLAFKEGFQLGRSLDDYKGIEEAYKDSMTREMTGETISNFPPQWVKFFEEMQLNCGFPLYNAFRLQWYNHFTDEFSEQVNLPILQMIVTREKCFNPKRAMKFYKKAMSPSLWRKIKNAYEMIMVARAARNL